MKFAVLVFPGSNCDRDMYNAIKSGAQAIMLIIVRRHWMVTMAY